MHAMFVLSEAPDTDAVICRNSWGNTNPAFTIEKNKGDFSMVTIKELIWKGYGDRPDVRIMGEIKAKNSYYKACEEYKQDCNDYKPMVQCNMMGAIC